VSLVGLPAAIERTVRRSPFADFRPTVRRALPWLVGLRFISNSGVRFPFTFLPALARGSGLSVESLSLILSLRDLTAVAAPAVGRVSDRRSSSSNMGLASIAIVVGLGLSAFGHIGLIVGFFIFGFSKLMFDISMNAWIGDNVAYERRGRVIGLVELSWAASALVGLPLLGILISQVGWWAAPAFLSVLALPLSIGILTRADDSGEGIDTRGPSRRPIVNRLVVVSLSAFGAMALASQFLLIGHGLWLEDTYGFNPARIGFAVMIIGAIEAVASTASSALGCTSITALHG
jgi:DHA1 family inner membrane transport protein